MVKLIGTIEVVTGPEKGFRESSVEAEQYEDAYAQLVNALAEGERLTSVRCP